LSNLLFQGCIFSVPVFLLLRMIHIFHEQLENLNVWYAFRTVITFN
jgi:hypothetical protein